MMGKNNVWKKLIDKENLEIGKVYVFYSERSDRMTLPKTFLQHSASYQSEYINWTTLMVWNFSHYKEYYPPNKPKIK